MPTFADIRKAAAAKVRADAGTTGKCGDNLKAMTTDKINFMGNKPNTSSSSPSDTGWTKVNNAKEGYSIEQQGDPSIATKILAKKKHG